jgi:hypothetical protein
MLELAVEDAPPRPSAAPHVEQSGWYSHLAANRAVPFSFPHSRPQCRRSAPLANTPRSRPGPTLIWSPLVEHVIAAARNAGGLRILVAPFATSEGVRSLLDAQGATSDLKVICRWSARDVASGIADLNVYSILKERGIPLFLHPSIHLKLYVFSNSTAFTSSANVTAKGLGLVDACNVEVGATVVLDDSDWNHLFSLFDSSVRVDDAVYEKALAYQKEHARDDTDPLPPLELAPTTQGSHSISALPACPDPETFAAWHGNPQLIPASELSEYIHDRMTYQVPQELTGEKVLKHVRSHFRNHPFVKDLVAYIQAEGSLPFGGIKAWLQTNCTDRPVPYRWELTRNTQILYAWLAYCYEEITWDRPRHSMVIRWTPRNPSGASARPGR